MEPLRIAEGSRHHAKVRRFPLYPSSRVCHFTRGTGPGHELLDTHPVDIERALKKDYSKDPRRRDLQMEAKAHIAVQQWIDQGGLGAGSAATAGAIREIHRRFCELPPEDLLWVDDREAKERIRLKPGEPRRRDVLVGRPIAISPGSVPRFLERSKRDMES